MLGLGRDITKRRQMELQLEASEAHLRMMLESSSIAVRIMRIADRKIVFANQNYASLFNATLGYIMDADLTQFYKNCGDFEHISSKLNAGENVLNIQLDLVILNNEIKHVTASYFLLDYEGQPATLGWLFDVTDLQKST